MPKKLKLYLAEKCRDSLVLLTVYSTVRRKSQFQQES
jgi:hypothetical protein